MNKKRSKYEQKMNKTLSFFTKFAFFGQKSQKNYCHYG